MEVLSIEKHEGYEVRKERFCGRDYGLPDGECMDMETAYTAKGEYIGDPKFAESLIDKFGIVPEYASPDSNACQVGFSEHAQGWFGWSHRAMAVFKIGDKLFDADFAERDENTPFQQCGAVTIETLEQARQAAVNFAEYVS